MGLNEPTVANTIYVNVANGQFYRRVKAQADHPRAKPRTLEDGRVIYEVEYPSLDGIVTGIALRSTDFNGKHIEKGQWVVHVEDRGQVFAINLPYSSSYAKRLINALANLPALDRSIRIFPWRMENKGKPGKFYQGVTVYSIPGNRDSKVLPKYSKDDVPPMKEVMLKGQTQWDDTDQMIFFERVVETEILPKLSLSKSAVAIASMTDGRSNDSDDLSFLNDTPVSSQAPDEDDGLPFF
jgi:hypothetical protein